MRCGTGELIALDTAAYAQPCANCDGEANYRLAIGPLLSFWCEACLVERLSTFY